MRWLTNFYDFTFKWTATAAIGIHPTKTWLSQLVNFKNVIWTWGHFRRTICNKIVLNLEKMPQKRMECFRLLFDHLAWIEHQFLSGIRDSRKSARDDERCGRSKEVNTPQLIGQRVRVRVTKSANLSLSQTIWPRWASRQLLSLPIVETLLLVTFGYSLSSEAVGMRQLKRWKRLWQRSLTSSHKRTSMSPSRSCWNGTTSALQPEEITWKGTRVSCVYYQ